MRWQHPTSNQGWQQQRTELLEEQAAAQAFDQPRRASSGTSGLTPRTDLTPGILRVHSPSGAFNVVLSQVNTEIEPGSQQEMQVEVQNNGLIREAVQLSVTGFPAGWLTYRRDMIELNRGEKATLSFMIQPALATVPPLPNCTPMN